MDRTRKMKGKRALLAATLLVVMLIVLASPTAYAAADSIRITVKQEFTTVSASADGTFAYRLKPLGPGNPMPMESTADGYTFDITGTDSREIGPFSCNQPGVYCYELFQVIETEKPGYTYDKRVYTIEVHVDGALDMKIVVRNQNGEKEGDIEFRNCYRPSPPVGPPVNPPVSPPVSPPVNPPVDRPSPSDPDLMADPPVRKTVSGNPACKTTFEFKLVARDASYPMPAGSVDGTKMIKIAGSGEGEFGTWSYDTAGTYYYTVYEVNTGASGYSYDTTVYTITDMVKEENGELAVTRVVTNDLNKPVPAFAFVNKFSEGKEGPKTGDDTDTALYGTIFAAGGALAIGAALYLIVGGRRKEGGKKI